MNVHSFCIKALFRCAGILLVSCSLAGQVRSELLLFYDFNDASNPTQAPDGSGQGNVGELFDAEYTSDGGGRTGAAGDRGVDFGDDQDGRYLEVVTAEGGAFDSITDNDAATISLWAYGGDFQPQNNFAFWFADGDADPRQLGAHIPWSNGNIYFDAAGCCGATQRITAPLDPDYYLDTWTHYAFVKDGEYTAIYVDGELFLDSGDNIIDPLGPITTVRFGSGQEPGQWSYNGFMDDIAVWDEALTEQAIADLAAGGNPGGGAGVAGDFNGDQILDATDIDLLTSEVKSNRNDPAYDLNGDGSVNQADRDVWVRELKHTYYGDANLDGEFNSSDFVDVFQVGEYENAVTGDSTWSDGDWSGDMEFTSGDFVVAFQDSGFEQGPRPATAVPEPSTLVTLLLCLLPIGRQVLTPASQKATS